MICEKKFKLKKDGTLSNYCICRTPELIENYDKAIADATQTWQCHHRLETHNSDGERRLVDISSSELIALGMYYDRPPEELVFLTELEHKRLHNVGKHVGKQFSEETRRKISEANKGKHFGFHSEEARRKRSETMKGHTVSEETRKKISEAHRGRHWFNNGEICTRCFECPEGFVPGILR